MKYKLINKTTGEEHICYMVVIDGWHYYISGNEVQVGDIVVELYVDGTIGLEQIDTLNDIDSSLQKKVIATNNPNIDILQVVDEVEILANLYCKEMDRLAEPHDFNSFKYAYNKSQETHPFSEEDVKEIFKIAQMQKNYGDYKPYTFEETIQLWKEQRPKTLYYE
jgi:hypothetical protein